MTVESATAAAGTGSVPEARLEANAIGVAQDTVIGMATSAPAASVGLTLAALAAATAYAGGPVIILTAVPMIIIANCYRRLNLWNANCGASFEWVGRVISPYLGFLTGWLMIMGGIIGTVSTTGGPRAVGTRRLRLHLHQHRAESGHRHRGGPRHAVIAIVGIRITARTQVGMGPDRVRNPSRVRHRRPGGGHQPPARHLPHFPGLVQPERHRRPRQPGRRVPGRDVLIYRLGRHHLRQRRGQAPPH